MSQLTTGQPAPDFSTTDVTGKLVSLRDYWGKTVLLTFQRNVGCPVCNLRYHELQTQQDSLRASDIEVLSVYESSAENMHQYLDNDQVIGKKPGQPYARMIPDPEEELYAIYGVERSVAERGFAARRFRQDECEQKTHAKPPKAGRPPRPGRSRLYH